MVTCWHSDELDITLSQDGPIDFEVRYGKQVRRGLSYVEAAHELGECILHALSCGGTVDNTAGPWGRPDPEGCDA